MALFNFFRRPDPRPEPTNLELVNVLLLDDDENIVTILKTCLEARRFVVTTATNGVEGLKEVMAQDFDVIICDLMMPKMPGDMFYVAVQRTKPLLCERFVFITGYAENPKLSRFLQTVKAPILTKPFKSEALFEAIVQVMKDAAPLSGG